MVSININQAAINNNGVELPLLKNISFKIKKGEIFTIIGRNGCGKSTFLKILTGLHSKNISFNGSVQFNNFELTKASNNTLLDYRKKRIRYVFQDPISSLNPLKKLKYYFQNDEISMQTNSKIFEELGLKNPQQILNSYPHELSTGMAQRVMLAIAVSVNPNLLVLDEPTSAVDKETTEKMIRFLKNWISTEDRAVLLVTQDLFTAVQLGTHFSMITNDGELKFLDSSISMQELKTNLLANEN
ncbi:MAG: ATP-binding cassette domain-containing protein [Melioribacteraceae bacterium]|nr:ATP-binding cassette domain-containing protein [Melioribacteraceae bacterium]MCF8264823.1 ATP-binding cassette domain-containing protein [Melioribacteraceae bacterium]MCF8432591.1 ATP-binding cassette domain-containing protein [Melioribacteraceae bacterium]